MNTLEKGMVLGGTYEIIEEIGAGGGGVVFLAKHLRLQTDVVVKKIKDDVLGKVESRKEADILKKLKHPHLPRVYDFIETEDGIYTVMDYIQGKDIGDSIKEHGKYSQKQVRKWAEQLGEALSYLHSQQPPIIHSDIKPANIMLTEDGNVCLIDFNISLAMGESMESAVGISTGFSPPEQYRDPALYARITHNYILQKSSQVNRQKQIFQNINEDHTELLPTNDEKTELLPENEEKNSMFYAQEELVNLPEYTKYFGKGIDTRSDIYSLGVTLYYLLTGIEPPADFKQRIPIGDTKSQVSEGFATILEKMMALSPSERYSDGKEYLKAIRNCHKLDHRYIVMRRKLTGIQIAALGSLTLGILFIFSGLHQIHVEQNNTYYNLIRQAEEAIGFSNYEGAIELLSEAKSIFETHIEAYEEEIHMLYLQGDYEECIRQGETYLNVIPFDIRSEEDEEHYANIYYIIGNACYETEDYSNARRFLEYALQYYVKNGLFYRDYAITLARLGQIEEAQEELEKGIALGITQDSIYMAEGEIAHVKGSYEEAAGYLEQAISLTEDKNMKKRALLLCSDVYRSIGDETADNEIILLEQNLGLFDSGDMLALEERLAGAYIRKAQIDEARANEYYEKALAMFQKVYDSGYLTYQLQQNIAILYENMDRFDEAEETLRQMAEEYPERYGVYMRLAYLEADRQQMKENVDRNYLQMYEYYERAKALYEGKEQDMEMEMLEVMIQELHDGGWL